MNRHDRPYYFCALFSITALLIADHNSYAGFIKWRPEDGGNGHYYGLVLPTSAANSYTWTQARSAAEATHFLGSQGHLVTISSAVENDFLRSNFSASLFDNFPNSSTDRIYAWIGLYAPTQTAPFQWVTGEPVGYTNWGPSEPNFFGSEFWQYTHYWTRDFGSGPSWTWNNDRNIGFNPPFNTYGYIVEFDGPFVNPVPEPATSTLLATGLLCLIVFGRRYHMYQQAVRP